MFGLTRWSPFEDMLALHREVDRLFNQFWSDLPARTAATWSPSFNVRSGDEAWTIEVPLPGIDPERVNLEVAGNSLTIRVQEGDSKDQNATRWEQTLTLPQFLDLDKITANYRHGLLALTVPLKDAVKPRRIAIQTTDTKQLTAAA